MKSYPRATGSVTELSLDLKFLVHSLLYSMFKTSLIYKNLICLPSDNENN